MAVVQSKHSVTDTLSSGASPLPHWLFVADKTVDNSALFDFDRAFPTVDVALTGAGHGKLGLIHILIDG